MDPTTTKLEKNRSGYYEIRWTEDRRSRTVSTRTKNLAEAQAFRREWIAAELEAGRTAAADPTIFELAEQYLEHVEHNGRGSAQRWSLRMIKARLGGLRPNDLGLADIERYRAHRMTHVTSGTVRRELAALTAVLNWSAKMRLIPREHVHHIPLPPEGQARRGFLDETQEARLWNLAAASAGTSRAALFICIALATAARKEAILTLTWDRVDLSPGGSIDFLDPNRVATKKRRARLPIASRLHSVLKEAAHRATTVYVLGHPGTIRTEYEAFMARAGFAGITPHDLRRTWATLRARRGVSLWEIAQVLGDTVETVTKHYAVHQPDHLRKAIE